jgi:hypothetical protein
VLLFGADLGLAALLQSETPSSGGAGSLGAPISPRPLNDPNLDVLLSSKVLLAEGLNLPPMVHTSSLSAALGCPSGVEKPEPRRLNEGSSGSAGMGPRGRLEDRQSLASSATLGGGPSAVVPSNRRREEPRESGKSGSGPSRLHGLSNLASSSNPPFSLAV